jgi:hypothetical protein
MRSESCSDESVEQASDLPVRERCNNQISCEDPRDTTAVQELLPPPSVCEYGSVLLSLGETSTGLAVRALPAL